MRDELLQLFPLPHQEVPLKGLYLGHDLREQSSAPGKAFVYSNFITSIDGRIAVQRVSEPGTRIPEHITNPRDWRLFLELAVQADILITTGRYLRDYAEGRAQEILNVYDDPGSDDLRQWRGMRGLPPYPDLAIVSNSLDFPVPPVLTEGDRSVLVVTSRAANPERLSSIRKQASKVIISGDADVNGQQLVADLSELGYRTVYSTAGPKIMHLLLAGGALDRQYVTIAARMLGGAPFSSMVEGSLLDPPYDFQLTSAYLDQHALGGLGQLLIAYDRM